MRHFYIKQLSTKVESNFEFTLINDVKSDQAYKTMLLILH